VSPIPVLKKGKKKKVVTTTSHLELLHLQNIYGAGGRDWEMKKLF